MSEERAMSDVVWTPEHGSGGPEVRSIAWNNWLTSDDTTFPGRRSRTAADIRITPDTALASTVVLACCRILAETISSLPLNVMRRTPNGGKEIAYDIPLQKVLSFAPNEWQTKFEFFEQVVMTLTLWGNSYSRIRSGKYGAVSALDNLHPSRMDVERLENGRLRYSYTNPETGRLERYTQDQIMHVRWTAEPDGIKGMVPVEIAREAIALARACEIHAAKFWANSAQPGIVLQTDGSLSPEAAERLRDNWERLHRGVDRAHRTAVLTNGLKVEPVGFTAEQSQFESTRRFQTEEIIRVYRLPLHLVQGTTGGDLETSGQEFVTYTLVPWLRRIESAISRSLIYNDDVFFAEFDTKGLMRADSNRRAAFYSTMTGLGIYSINDCRRSEGLAPIEHGDKHFVAMNQQTLEEAVKPKPVQDPMAALMGGAGAPPPAQGGVPSQPEVKKGEAPKPAEQGVASEKKATLPPEGAVVTWGDGRVGEVQHVMEQGTLDLKSGEKIEVQPGEPVALVVDSESGEEVGVKVSELKPAEPKAAVEEQRSADCGRDESGRFGQDNKCQEDAGESSSSQDSSPGRQADSEAPGESQDSQDKGGDNFAAVAREILRSIDKTGGYSVHPITAESPTSGFMVSTVTDAEEILDGLESVTEDKVREYFEKNAERLTQNPKLHLGGWFNLEDGKVYLDLSERFDSIDDAIDAAEDHKQLAIWDLNTKSEIRQEDYSGRRTRPRREKESRAVRLSARSRAERNRRGDSRSRLQTARREEGERRSGIEGRQQVEHLIEAARFAAGELPKIEFRAIGAAAATYIVDADTIFVSPELTADFSDEVASGWLSQANPILHEAAHRLHAFADFGSYTTSASLSFTDEQRSLIESEVSRYAATSGREFVAEALAGQWSGKKYSKKIGSLVRSVTNGKVRL